MLAAGTNLLGQLLSNGWNMDKVNISAVGGSLVTGNPFLSEGIGQALNCSSKDGFSKSFLFGSEHDVKSFLLNTAIGGSIGVGSNSAFRGFVSAGGGQSYSSGLRDCSLFLGSGAKPFLNSVNFGIGSASNAGGNIIQDEVNPENKND
ncbi:MAG: hypothetical protein JNM95_14910 [Chitinophagaceae bacterium]|nr:hypothetical protein [Chitinophagaceae bacterium]